MRAHSLLLVLFLVSCAEAGPLRGDDAVTALEEDTGARWRVAFRRDATPSLLARDRAVAARRREGLPDDAEPLARTFVERWPGLFGAAAAPEGLVIREVGSDGVGGARVRFGVTIDGLPLEGGDAVVAVDQDGAVRLAAGSFPRSAHLAAKPVVSATTAVEVARARVLGVAPDALLFLERDPELLASTIDGIPRPMWRVVLGAHGLRREVHVDAVSGDILHEREGLLAGAAVGSGIGLDGRRRELDVFEGSDGYRLRDVTRTADAIRTYTADGRERLPGLIVRSDDLDAWDVEGPFAGAAVDGHANAAFVYDYLDTLGRRSVDGQDGPIRIVVHYGEGVANAFWDGRRAVFGDGDGATSGPFASALDVVGHELFHGVIETSAGLVYEGESGALNESLADVFGSLVERRGGGGDWLIGEDVSAEPLRDLARPARHGLPEHMREYIDLPLTPAGDMGGVHLNSTIPSYAAVLLADGGTHWSGVRVPAIGDESLERIWFRALVLYTTPRASFEDFALATRAAAEDLHGPHSAEVEAVERAWRAVGVLE